MSAGISGAESYEVETTPPPKTFAYPLQVVHRAVFAKGYFPCCCTPEAVRSRSYVWVFPNRLEWNYPVGTCCCTKDQVGVLYYDRLKSNAYVKIAGCCRCKVNGCCKFGMTVIGCIMVPGITWLCCPSLGCRDPGEVVLVGDRCCCCTTQKAMLPGILNYKETVSAIDQAIDRFKAGAGAPGVPQATMAAPVQQVYVQPQPVIISQPQPVMMAPTQVIMQ